MTDTADMPEGTTDQTGQAALEAAAGAALNDMAQFDAARVLQHALGLDEQDLVEDWRAFALAATHCMPDPDMAAQIADSMLAALYMRRARQRNVPLSKEMIQGFQIPAQNLGSASSAGGTGGPTNLNITAR